jgi:hypothetical protein
MHRFEIQVGIYSESIVLLVDVSLSADFRVGTNSARSNFEQGFENHPMQLRFVWSPTGVGFEGYHDLVAQRRKPVALRQTAHRNGRHCRFLTE